MKRPFPLVEVVWDDAHCSTDMGHEEGHKPVTTYSVGYQVKRDRAGITIAQDCYETGKEYRVWSFIPRGMIQSVTRLGPTKEDGTRKRRVKRQGPDPSQLPRPYYDDRGTPDE